jgi:hypothetical protein
MIKTTVIKLLVGTSVVLTLVATANAEKAASCTWANRTFSQGAIFCVGPKTAVACTKDGTWATQGSFRLP